MSKKTMISRKFIPVQFPVGGTVLTYLLYKNINPHGSLKGVLLTLFIGWWIIVWIIVIAQLFTVEFKDPVFKDEK